MTTYKIEKKMSGAGTIYDIASDRIDREVAFPARSKYAVVLASYYGGRGYTTHQSKAAAIRQSRKLDRGNYAHAIIGTGGRLHGVVHTGYGWDLEPLPWEEYER